MCTYSSPGLCKLLLNIRYINISTMCFSVWHALKYSKLLFTFPLHLVNNFFCKGKNYSSPTTTYKAVKINIHCIVILYFLCQQLSRTPHSIFLGLAFRVPAPAPRLIPHHSRHPYHPHVSIPHLPSRRGRQPTPAMHFASWSVPCPTQWRKKIDLCKLLICCLLHRDSMEPWLDEITHRTALYQ